MTLPTDSKGRKDVPVASGVLDYFPDAVAALARVSKIGNDKHNPGQPLHWSRDKSTDHADCLIRHFLGRGTIDQDCGLPHEASMAWRAMAMLQLAMEKLALASATKAEPRPANTTVGQVGVAWSHPNHLMGADATTGYAAPPPPPQIQVKVEPRNTLEPGWLVEGNQATPLPRQTQPKPFTFWYLATPYTNYPHGHEMAAGLAERLAAELMSNGIPVFSPIAHSHPIAKYMAAGDKVNHELWMKMDGPLMEAASGLIVVTDESWEKSKGIAEEIKRFNAAGKPVVYWAPWCVIPRTVAVTGGRKIT